MDNVINDALNKLNDLLSKANLDDVSSESSGFSDLPDGYYLCEVDKAEIKESKNTKNPMISFKMKVVEDGYIVKMNKDDEPYFERAKSTKHRCIFIHFVIKDEASVKRFASDMLKFEGDTPGESLLPKEAFMTSDTLEDSLDLLLGMNIYVQVSTTEKDDGTKSTWNNFISWKRAGTMGLPVD